MYSHRISQEEEKERGGVISTANQPAAAANQPQAAPFTTSPQVTPGWWAAPLIPGGRCCGGEEGPRLMPPCLRARFCWGGALTGCCFDFKLRPSAFFYSASFSGAACYHPSPHHALVHARGFPLMPPPLLTHLGYHPLLHMCLALLGTPSLPPLLSCISWFPPSPPPASSLMRACLSSPPYWTPLAPRDWTTTRSRGLGSASLSMTPAYSPGSHRGPTMMRPSCRVCGGGGGGSLRCGV